MVKVTKTKKTNFKPIKPFKSYEEEANFWDTHSFIDEINDGTLVGFHQANKTSTLTIRFDPKDVQKLREKAFQLGVGPTTLARMWIRKRLS